MIGTGWLWLGVALAAGDSVGVHVAAFKDLPDGPGLGPDEGAEFDMGNSLALHHHWNVVDGGVTLRSSLFLEVADGTDRLTWEDYEGWERTVSDHVARTVWTRISTGPEITMPSRNASQVSPYMGAGLGLGVVHVRHPYNAAGAEGDWPYLQERGTEGLGPGSEVRIVQTTQLLPSASAWLGLRFFISDSMAIALESGYTVCHVTKADLKARPYSFQVDRSGFGLNTFRLGIGLQVQLPAAG